MIITSTLTVNESVVGLEISIKNQEFNREYPVSTVNIVATHDESHTSNIDFQVCINRRHAFNTIRGAFSAVHGAYTSN